MRKTCLDQIYELAKRDSRVVFIGSDIGSGTLEHFKREIPNRFFMEGVSEAHLVSMMAGLAMEGKIPYMNTIATFMTRRPFEQIVLDAGLHKTKVRLIGSGSGAVYGPLGPTHLALDDIAILRVIPGMTIVAPCDADEMKRLMLQTLDYDGPIYIRLAKGGDPIVSRPDFPFKIGQAIVLREGDDVLLVSTGITTQIALETAAILEREKIFSTVIFIHTLKPLDRKRLRTHMEKVHAIVSIEEHFITGGLGSAVAEVLAESDFDAVKRFVRVGFPDEFIHTYGSQSELMKKYGITSQNIANVVAKMLNSKLV